MSKEKILAKLRAFGKARIIFVILTLLWIPWGILCFPGNLPWDAGLSIAWHTGLDRSNPNNPWFQNLMLGLFYQAGDAAGIPELGPCVYCWIQMILEAWLLSRVIAYLSDRAGAGKWAYLLVALFALPVFPIYAFMMGKDSSYALVLLGMVYLLIRAAVEGDSFWALRRNRVLLAVLPAALGMLRNLGGVIPLAVFAVLALVKLKRKGVLPAAFSALLLAVFTLLVPRIAGVPAGEIREHMSMPLQTAAYYAEQHPDEITDGEKETISKVIDYDYMQENYTPYLADPIKNASEFTPETRAEFLGMWFGMLGKHPGTILEGWRRSTDLYFSLTETNPVKSSYFIGVRFDPTIQEQLGVNSWEEGNLLAKDIFRFFMDIPVIRTLQLSGLYSYLAVLLLLCTLFFRKIRKFLPCCILLFMVLAACLLSPVNGYYRYAYPMILSLPAVLYAVCGSLKKRQ